MINWCLANPPSAYTQLYALYNLHLHYHLSFHNFGLTQDLLFRGRRDFDVCLRERHSIFCFKSSQPFHNLRAFRAEMLSLPNNSSRPLFKKIKFSGVL